MAQESVLGHGRLALPGPDQDRRRAPLENTERPAALDAGGPRQRPPLGAGRSLAGALDPLDLLSDPANVQTVAVSTGPFNSGACRRSQYRWTIRAPEWLGGCPSRRRTRLAVADTRRSAASATKCVRGSCIQRSHEALSERMNLCDSPAAMRGAHRHLEADGV